MKSLKTPILLVYGNISYYLLSHVAAYPRGLYVTLEGSAACRENKMATNAFFVVVCLIIVSSSQETSITVELCMLSYIYTTH